MNEADNSRIAKNTLFLYFRMLLIMAVQFYASRVVLKQLGVIDFGIYNVVAGLVALFGFVNASMTASTQRFLTFHLDQGDPVRLKQIFATCIHIHVLISLLLVVLAETAGLWYLREKMVIPAGREQAAFWVYQLSILSAVVSIMSFPYMADIIAREKMSAFARISIVEALLKLSVVFLLAVAPLDRLVFYAALVAAVQLIVCGCYKGYANRFFEESHYRFYHEKALFGEILGFAGWSLWGNTAAVMAGQGLNLLLNLFFGPAMNAARAVSVQVQSVLMQFANNFQTAVNPQITKTYAGGQLAEMHILVLRSARFSYLLLLVLCLPLLFETPFLLDIWLDKVPAYSVVFVRLMILITLIDMTANPLMISASATGRVKVYQSVVGSILLLILPLSYWVLHRGGEPWSVYVVHLAVCCVAYVVRLLLVRPLIGLSVGRFVVSVVLRCLGVTAAALVLPLLLWYFKPVEGLWGSLLMIVVCVLSALAGAYTLGLSAEERRFVLSKIAGPSFFLSRSDQD